MKRIAVLIRDVQQQYEGLRVSLGALLHEVAVDMYVLEHEIAEMDEAYRDNMEFLDEMAGRRFSNNTANVEKYNFRYATLKETAERIKNAEMVIPF